MYSRNILCHNWCIKVLKYFVKIPRPIIGDFRDFISIKMVVILSKIKMAAIKG